MARKLCATELFSARRVDSFEHVRAQEVRALMRDVFERAGTAVQVKERLASLAMRSVLRMLAGDRWSRIGDSVGEWLPWLGWLDLQGFIRRMKLVHNVQDRFFEKILDEHERRQEQPDSDVRATAGQPAARDDDLVDVLLQLAGEQGDGAEEREARLTRDGVKAFIHDIILGGTETTAVTVEWAMAELLRHPDAMAAATEELDRVVGCERWVTERDLPDLRHVGAVVKETLRLHPPGPLLFPHHASEDTVVGGYDVPAGARVLVNVWAVARDPASWPDAPDEFRPERFLTGGGAEGMDVRGAHFELLPFGSGRRTCPAHNLATKQVTATLANMLHGFTSRLPDGVAPEDVSMEEFFGLSMKLKVPLVAVAEARLPEHLYAAVD